MRRQNVEFKRPPDWFKRFKKDDFDVSKLCCEIFFRTVFIYTTKMTVIKSDKFEKQII